MPDLPKNELHWQALCDRFNAGGYWQRAQDGEFIREGTYDEEIQNPGPETGPPGTRSQVEKWSGADGELVAVVHLYLRPDGSLGGRRHLPKPKVLVEDGVHYFAHDQFKRQSN